jgi:hypothetical protein
MVRVCAGMVYVCMCVYACVCTLIYMFAKKMLDARHQWLTQS